MLERFEGEKGTPEELQAEPYAITGAIPTKEADALTQTLTERGSRYGKFKDHAIVTQKLKAVLRDHMGPAKWGALTPSQVESLEMICHKLGRIANGDPNYADSWVDIAGYAKLVSDELEGVVR